MSETSNHILADSPITDSYHIDDQYLQHLLSELTFAKAKLEEGKAKSAAMLNSLGEGLIVTNEHGQITTVNSYALECLGYTESELLGKWFPKTIIAADRNGKPLRQLDRPIVKALASGRIISDYIHYLTRTGDLVPVHVTVSPVTSANLPTGAIEVFQDLTREQQLDIAKEEFVSLASHQLRTPATGMKSILSMLASGDFGPLTDLQQKYLQKAIQTNDRQLEIIEGLLNVALVDAGKMELDLDYIDLAAVIRDVVSEHRPILETRCQTVALDIEAPVTLLLDLQKIRMIIDNLISNAGKYSPSGANIQIGLSTEGEWVEFSVTDQGVGISDADLPKLFSKFTRLQNELSAAVGGTGLGLYLTKSLVELHGGDIEVTSKESHGSTFTIRLPRKMSFRHV